MIVITGGTGRVGRALVEALLEGRKYRGRLRLIVRDAAEAKKFFPAGVQFGEADLCSPHDFIPLAEACKGADAIIHLAASVDYSLSEEELFCINAGGAAAMLRAAKLQKELPKFILLSSTSVYRGVKGALISENSPPNPTNAYGRSKLEAEMEVKRSGLEYIILRAPIVYGPGFRTGFAQVVKLVGKGRMPIIGSGSNRIPHIYVGDLIRGIMLALGYSGKSQEFILASGESLTQAELLNSIADELHAPHPKMHVPKALAYAGAGLMHSLYALFRRKPKIFKEYVHTLAEDRAYDISKAGRLLRFKPDVKIKEGLHALAADLLKSDHK